MFEEFPPLKVTTGAGDKTNRVIQFAIAQDIDLNPFRRLDRAVRPKPEIQCREVELKRDGDATNANRPKRGTCPRLAGRIEEQVRQAQSECPRNIGGCAPRETFQQHAALAVMDT